MKGITFSTIAKVNAKYVGYKLYVKSEVSLFSKACHPVYIAPAESSREPEASKTQLCCAKLRADRDFKQSPPYPGPQAVQTLAQTTGAQLVCPVSEVPWVCWAGLAASWPGTQLELPWVQLQLPAWSLAAEEKKS